MSNITYPTQSNTTQGDIVINSKDDTSAKEGYLVKLADAGSEPEVALPTDEADICQYIVLDGATADSDCTVRPLQMGQQVRIKANGTGSAGDKLALATISTNAGEVETLPADADTYYIVGYAEEDFVDGQLVKVRVWPSTETVT